jgi:Transglutaminase-like superfamily
VAGRRCTGVEAEVAVSPAEMQDVLEFYATPGRFTTLEEGTFASRDVDRVVEVVQGLLLYDTVAKVAYGVDLDATQAEAIHERDTARYLAIARSLDARPYDQARAPTNRIGARCHAFSRVTVAFLRAAGVPARARCGFGAYFRPGWFEDHWVAEYWSGTESRWQMVDAQLDAMWRNGLGYQGDPLAVTASEFVTAGAAWQAWRRGELEASRCGLSAVDEHGAHWIAGNLRLDFASLNKVEMLPWDVWGAHWEPGGQPTDVQLAFFDGVAELTVHVDSRFEDLRARYDTDEELRVGTEVFNVLRGRIEAV